jgi:hypothetical protein
MTRAASPDEIADHNHDLRKHELRPRNTMDARTVAMIARAVSEDEAAALIERYARTFAAFAAREATERACEKIRVAVLTTMNAPVPR